MQEGDSQEELGARERIGLWFGPALFVLIVLVPAPSLGVAGQRTLAMVAWMAVWWVTAPAPLAVTSMLPLVLLPLMGVRSVRAVAPNYTDQIIFLFLGGFILALAVERSGLHRRLALATLSTLGGSPRRLVWGFLLVTAALSMWLSNTATALMMLPIADGVARRLEDDRAGTRLFLAVAYGASLGGIGTLIGTPPNLVLAGMATSLVPGLPALTFGGWMLFSVPLLLILLPVAALRLGRGLARAGLAGEELAAERRSLGPWRPAERRAAILFAVTAVAWITRSGFEVGTLSVPGWANLLPDPKLVTDAVPAVGAAILAALVPAGGERHGALVTWRDIRHGVPWGILLLFGGGFAIADAMHASGVDGWLAGLLQGLGGLPLVVAVLVVALLATTATEFTSNTATATLLMPVMAALAVAVKVPPYLLMVPAIVATSCAFMLPVATPPNAIVMGTGRVSTMDLFREGVWLNLASAVVITVLTVTLGRLVLP